MLDRIRAGLSAGLAAGLAVAVMVLVYDVARLDPLSTPRLLASSVLGAPVELGDRLGVLAWTAGALQLMWSIALYTIVHFAIFALVGLGAAFVFRPQLLAANVATGALYGGVVGTAVFYAGLAFTAPDFVSTPDWRLVVVTNVVAGVVLVSQLIEPVGADPTAGESAAA